MYNVSNNFKKQLNANYSQPAIIVEIELPGIDKKIVRSEQKIFAIPEALPTITQIIDKSSEEYFIVELAGSDKKISEVVREKNIFDANVTVYLMFKDLAEDEKLPLLTGRINSCFNDEEKNIIQLTALTQKKIAWNKYIGEVTNRKKFSKIPVEEEGKILPIVYGNAKRIKAQVIQAPVTTELAVGISEQDKNFIVNNARCFSVQELLLRINEEIVKGKFIGNKFFCTERGLNIYSGKISKQAGNYKILTLENLEHNYDNQFAGLYAKYFANGYEQNIKIVSSVASSKTLYLEKCFVDSNNQPTNLKINEYINIGSIVQSHDAGTIVREEGVPYIYVVNARESGGIQKVEAWAVNKRVASSQGIIKINSRQDYQIISKENYQVELNNKSILPGKSLTIIKMFRPPSEIENSNFTSNFTSNNIYVSLEGVKNTSTNKIVHKAQEVIKDLLITYTDCKNEDVTWGDSIDDFEIDCVIDKELSIAEIIQQLAWQACKKVCWKNNKISIVDLTSKKNKSQKILKNQMQDKKKIWKKKAADTNEIIAYYKNHGKYSVVHVVNDIEQKKQGRRVKELKYWALSKKYLVEKSVRFWLQKWSGSQENIQITSFLSTAVLDDKDTIEVIEKKDFLIQGQLKNIAYQSGKLQENKNYGFIIDLEKNIVGTCKSNCESLIVEGQCTSSCESGCEWKCENSCEDACELTCMASCEVMCQHACMLLKQVEGSCKNSCETTCQTKAEKEPLKKTLDLALKIKEKEETVAPEWEKEIKKWSLKNGGFSFTTLIAPPWIDKEQMLMLAKIAEIDFSEGGLLKEIRNIRTVKLVIGASCHEE